MVYSTGFGSARPGYSATGEGALQLSQPRVLYLESRSVMLTSVC